MSTERSAADITGARTGDWDVDKILGSLREKPDGMTRQGFPRGDFAWHAGCRQAILTLGEAVVPRESTPMGRAADETGYPRIDGTKRTVRRDPMHFRRDRADVAGYLATEDFAADVAELLRRWTEPRRPAVLIVLDWDPPWVDIYPEDELLQAFPEAALVQAGPSAVIGPGTLLILIVDVDGETAYAIADPRVTS